MRTSEWVIAAYFAYLIVTGVTLRASSPAMRRLIAVAVAVLALIAFLVLLSPSSATSVLRDWLPGGYLLAGYWATGLLYRGPSRAAEERLEAVDRALFAWFSRRGLGLPRAAREVLEFAYLCCYPLVPVGIAVLYLARQQGRADAYWTLVIASAFAAYAVLPWVGTRPPRAIEKTPQSRGACFFQRVNLVVLARGSIQVNTFPSGHAASASAVALFMTRVPGGLWPVFVLFAVAIGAGAIAGRYHYALDVVTGMALAGIAFLALGS